MINVDGEEEEEESEEDESDDDEELSYDESDEEEESDRTRRFEIKRRSRKKGGGGQKQHQQKNNKKKKVTKKKKKSDKDNDDDNIFGGNLENTILTLCKKRKFDQAKRIIDENKKKSDDDIDNDNIKQLFCESYFEYLVHEKEEYVLGINILLEYSVTGSKKLIPSYIHCAKMILWKLNYKKKIGNNDDDDSLNITPDEQSKIRHFLGIIEKLHKVFVKFDFGFYQSSKTTDSNKMKLGKTEEAENELLFQKWNQIVHLNYMKWKTMYNERLKGIHRKICISMVRYCDELRPDQLFFEAGNVINEYNSLQELRKSSEKFRGADGDENIEFGDLENIFYNRIWDIYDLIDEIEEDEGELDDDDEDEDESDEYSDEEDYKRRKRNQKKSGNKSSKNEFYYTSLKKLESTDFKDTDIPSTNICIPKHRFLDDEEMEEIEGKVLVEVVTLDDNSSSSSSSSNTNNRKKPQTFICERCHKPMYFASLRCGSCTASYLPCIITGFPVKKFEKVECTSCHRGIANRKDWNDYLVGGKDSGGGCPFCGVLQLTK